MGPTRPGIHEYWGFGVEGLGLGIRGLGTRGYGSLIGGSFGWGFYDLGFDIRVVRALGQDPKPSSLKFSRFKAFPKCGVWGFRVRGCAYRNFFHVNVIGEGFR